MIPHTWIGDYGERCFVDETGWMWTEYEDRDLDGRVSANYEEIAHLAEKVTELEAMLKRSGEVNLKLQARIERLRKGRKFHGEYV